MTHPTSIRRFTITPSLPTKLERLRDLAYNLWWCWNPEAIALYQRLDSDLWEKAYHNPVRVLGAIEQKRLEEAAGDDGFIANMERVLQRFDEYMAKKTWYSKTHNSSGEILVAYFSAEFGLDESVPTYAGGLGVLAGDHLKSASDLGLPLVGVGLLYQEGYFRQYLNADGWQQESYPLNDFYNMPVRLEQGADGEPVVVTIDYPDGAVVAQVWSIRVGRVTLFLLDTNIEANRPEDRTITNQLYGGDKETRLRQEILLGIGGIRALDALDLSPTVCQMNDGHSAFLALERIRCLIERENLSFREAKEIAAAGNIFTTHTPVPAGIDIFPFDLIKKYFPTYYPLLGLNEEEFLDLGCETEGEKEGFNMAILAFRLAAHHNGVSKLHGTVSRRMWQKLWPEVPEDEVPITSVTNGINCRAWVSHDMADLFDRYLGPRWTEDPTDQTVWEKVGQIPDEELWRTHERRRERLVAFARRRLQTQLVTRGATPSEIAFADGVLDPEALTIGFARRFTAYKRATLLLSDPDRLAEIMNDKDRPIQIIFAGKAHPHDNPAKELIRQIMHLSRREDLRRRIVFIEDYDMCVARYLVRGVDIWLNNPRRLLEASGTSGMKAAANGAINISVLDGWWDEAYRPSIGWAIGRDEVYDDRDYQDQVESNAIYEILEEEAIPLFYDRGPEGLPRGWIDMMKSSMYSLLPVFNTNRMVHDYTQSFYLPAAKRYQRLNRDGALRAKSLSNWKQGLKEHWPNIRIERIEQLDSTEFKVGSQLDVQAEVHLGPLKPDDVSVELYHGPIDPDGRIVNGSAITMSRSEEGSNGDCVFLGSIPCRLSGLHGYALRILPKHEDLAGPHEPNLILWG